MSSTPKVVTLSSGEIVTFKPYFNHGADFEFYRFIREEMKKAEEAGMVKEGKGIPTFVYLAACEGTLPLLIERIVQNGQDVPYTKSWLDGLHPKDYDLLSEAFVALRDELTARDEAGKKNA
jgi:hypothetical protein